MEGDNVALADTDSVAELEPETDADLVSLPLPVGDAESDGVTLPVRDGEIEMEEVQLSERETEGEAVTDGVKDAVPEGEASVLGEAVALGLCDGGMTATATVRIALFPESTTSTCTEVSAALALRTAPAPVGL